MTTMGWSCANKRELSDRKRPPNKKEPPSNKGATASKNEPPNKKEPPSSRTRSPA